MAKKPWDQMEPHEKVVDTLMTHFISPVGQHITALHNNAGITEEKRIIECRKVLASAGENCRAAFTKRFPEIWDWVPGPVSVTSVTGGGSLEQKLDSLIKMSSETNLMISKALGKTP
jgi:hypothetical protein